MEGDSIEPLINSILGKDSVRTLTDIRKTLIFHDGVNKGIDIANELIARLPSSMEGVDSSVTIANYFGDLDALSKTTILQNVRSGSTRVVICTDAFGLGIDVEDIEVVIQWGVSEKLIGSTLAQRIGRAARDPQRMGVAVVYVQSFILDYINREVRRKDGKKRGPLNRTTAATPDHRPSRNRTLRRRSTLVSE
jgi:superfamily II DNA/RNA helicase